MYNCCPILLSVTHMQTHLMILRQHRQKQSSNWIPNFQIKYQQWTFASSISQGFQQHERNIAAHKKYFKYQKNCGSCSTLIYHFKDWLKSMKPVLINCIFKSLLFMYLYLNRPNWDSLSVQSPSLWVTGMGNSLLFSSYACFDLSSQYYIYTWHRSSNTFYHSWSIRHNCSFITSPSWLHTHL